jgi:F-type H+-transporting ATPase subunit epsilon
MANTMHVELVSVERSVWSGDATAVYGITPEGGLGVLPRHSPLLAELISGSTVRIQTERDPELTVLLSDGGFLSVRPDGVSVLAQTAELTSAATTSGNVSHAG